MERCGLTLVTDDEYLITATTVSALITTQLPTEVVVDTISSEYMTTEDWSSGEGSSSEGSSGEGSSGEGSHYTSVKISN